jgi:arylsulfatase A-like enzyme
MLRRQFFALPGLLAARNAGPRPNIALLLTDDQRADTIHALGNPHIHTPNMDRLARSGFVFRNAYCLGSNIPAVCLPSRNMLLSGRAYFRYQRYASGSDPNLADALRDAGYVTWHYGKRGNEAVEIHKRFDYSHYLNDEQDRTCGEPGREIVDRTIEFLRARPKDRPFFLYLAFANPHDPRVAAPHYLARYDAARLPLPRNYLPVHPFDNGEMLVRDELLAPWPRTPEEIRRHLRDYYAVITGLDYHLGRLFGAMEELGLFGNTLFVFSSDNGLALGSHGLMGKQSLYEHSMKVPLILTGPGIRKGSSDALVYLMDLFPTLVDLVGAPIPPGLDGVSLKPILTGRSPKVRDTLFTAYRDVQRAIRDERWKLIVYPRINRKQLFDLKNDPEETRDLAGDPRYASIIERLMNQLRQWQQRFSDSVPLSSERPADPTFKPPSPEEYQQLRRKWKM